MSRARTLAGAIGSDGALNVADVAGLAAIASSGSASDLLTGTLPIARIADGALTTAKHADASITAAKLAAGATNTNAIPLIASGTLGGTYSAGTWYNVAQIVGTGIYLWEMHFSTWYAGGDCYNEKYSGWFSQGQQGSNSGAATNLYYANGGHSPNTFSPSFRYLHYYGADSSYPGQQWLQFNSNQTITVNNTEGRSVNWAIYKLKDS